MIRFLRQHLDLLSFLAGLVVLFAAYAVLVPLLAGSN